MLKHPKFFSRAAEIGQSLVESSVAFIILAFILSGVVDLGRAFFMLVTLEDAVGEAAIYVSIAPDCFNDQDPDYLADNSLCDDFSLNRAEDIAVAWVDPATLTANLSCEEIEDPDVAGTNCDNLVQDDTFEISVEYPFNVFTPIISGIAGDDTITLRTTAFQTVVVNTNVP